MMTLPNDDFAPMMTAPQWPRSVVWEGPASESLVVPDAVRSASLGLHPSSDAQHVWRVGPDPEGEL
ncbi:hypothetical protein [Actinobaculum sp. 313]|uniref:hypothetical protein n=1 Tax=Actinobaculum sp. 313 TaxID=2495645 RepID=UPI000D5295A6|nr:hypothetical protein [Actinobaculum sp. 313]AWE41485.1 hypothetical protein DDD63_00435 [Actinobaculum sp. 313]